MMCSNVVPVPVPVDVDVDVAISLILTHIMSRRRVMDVMCGVCDACVDVAERM